MNNVGTCGATRAIEARGLRLAAWEWGARERPAMLLLHSLAAHSHWWDGMAALLEDAFHIVALDFRGHGRSGHAMPPAYHFADYLADVVAALDVLGWRAPIVVGHSMGAYVGSMLAAHHTERVGALVIGDMLTGWTDAMSERARVMAERPAPAFASLDEGVARFRLTPPETHAPSGVLRHLAETGIVERDGAFTFAFDRHVFLHPPLDPWSFLPRIRCPALVIRGESSVVMPREAGERATAVLQQGSFVEVNDAWHHVILDDPAAFADAVSRWLADIQKGDLR